MAVTTGTVIDLKKDVAAEAALTSFTAADGITFPLDPHCVLLLGNSHATNASTFTIKGAAGFAGNGDLTVSVAAGKTYALYPQDSYYKNLSGTDKGLVKITASGGTPAAACLLLEHALM